ncbi:MAG: hypothetical protein ACI38O_03865 [Fibrobacter intestinalis]|uniref:hypothetical protein n=1 Tax=Fibrobacter intestinalis TaxID=28122 RepID=UPI003F0A64B2
MGAGSGISAGYSYRFPKVPEPFATRLKMAQEKRRAFQMELHLRTDCPKIEISKCFDHQFLFLKRSNYGIF